VAALAGRIAPKSLIPLPGALWYAPPFLAGMLLVGWVEEFRIVGELLPLILMGPRERLWPAHPIGALPHPARKPAGRLEHRLVAAAAVDEKVRQTNQVERKDSLVSVDGLKVG
jgi:hypothetical protein